MFYLGLEYIEESMNETRTAPNFYCKLCDCSFTDPHAKVMHTKGRRHRLQYKVSTPFKALLFIYKDQAAKMTEKQQQQKNVVSRMFILIIV